ncbi:universal stress protein [Chitinophaga sp. 212800010-3]|uniref:universal stress protein n=1 Tax=unclassified Chitinophaga TaxID=2619133 RepID=UPI002DE7010B|nr:Usp domain-containing protein [Chitinophaga sp. 212800010-3]
MNTMLILTDFSENAFRAMEYAASLTQPLQTSRIILYHAFQSFIFGTELPITNTPDNERLYLECMENLALQQDRLRALIHAGIRIDMKAEDALLADHINDFCAEENVDFIVMGVSGKSGLEKLLLGSTTSLIISTSKVPVLVVPKDTIIGKPLTSIIFTTDLKHHETIPVERLHEILRAFPATVRVLNVEKGAGTEKYVIETKESIASLHEIFEPYHASFDYLNDNNTVDGILAYSNQHQASLIIVIPRKQGGLAVLFHNSISKKLAYDSNIPLLCLPPADK